MPNSVASLWIGDRLSDIELASIKSFLRFGHPYTLYSYEPLINLPEGVIAADANDILPAADILRYAGHGSPAIHANIFRYAMLAATDHIWVDLDIIALKEFKFDSPWVMGFEDGQQINNAVLRLPKESAVLRELLKFRLDSRGLPPHETGFRRFKYWLQGLPTGGLHISRWPWGSTGPRALTHFAELTGEARHAMDVTAFYPIPFSQVRRFAEMGTELQRQLPQDSWAVHLWGKELRVFLKEEYGGKVPPGSIIDLALRGELG